MIHKDAHLKLDIVWKVKNLELQSMRKTQVLTSLKAMTGNLNKLSVQ